MKRLPQTALFAAVAGGIFELALRSAPLLVASTALASGFLACGSALFARYVVCVPKSHSWGTIPHIVAGAGVAITLGALLAIALTIVAVAALVVVEYRQLWPTLGVLVVAILLAPAVGLIGLGVCVIIRRPRPPEAWALLALVLALVALPEMPRAPDRTLRIALIVGAFAAAYVARFVAPRAYIGSRAGALMVSVAAFAPAASLLLLAISSRSLPLPRGLALVPLALVVLAGGILMGLIILGTALAGSTAGPGRVWIMALFALAIFAGLLLPIPGLALGVLSLAALAELGLTFLATPRHFRITS